MEWLSVGTGFEANAYDMGNEYVDFHDNNNFNKLFIKIQQTIFIYSPVIHDNISLIKFIIIKI